MDLGVGPDMSAMTSGYWDRKGRYHLTDQWTGLSRDQVLVAMKRAMRIVERIIYVGGGGFLTDPEVDDAPIWEMCQRCEGLGRYGGDRCAACRGGGAIWV